MDPLASLLFALAQSDHDTGAAPNNLIASKRSIKDISQSDDQDGKEMTSEAPFDMGDNSGEIDLEMDECVDPPHSDQSHSPSVEHGLQVFQELFEPIYCGT